MHDGALHGNDIQVGADWASATVPKVAKFIGVSERQVWRLVASGELKSFQVGRCRLVRRVDVLAFIDQAAAAAPGATADAATTAA